jgi:hypothetical protein
MSQHHAIAPRYARFLRRLQAMVFDSIVVVVVISAALLAVSTVRIDNFSRAVGIIVAMAAV